MISLLLCVRSIINPVNLLVSSTKVSILLRIKEDRLRGTAEAERLATRENKLSSLHCFLHHIIIIIISSSMIITVSIIIIMPVFFSYYRESVSRPFPALKRRNPKRIVRLSFKDKAGLTLRACEIQDVRLSHE